MNDRERIYTDTPLIDEIVYQVRGMIMDGIILKDEDEAAKYETLYSIQMADRYKEIVDGTAIFEMFTYDYEDLMKIPSMSSRDAIAYSKNNKLIQDYYKPILLKNKKEEFIANYEEQNNYYRCLYGLPDLGVSGIRLTLEQLESLGIAEFTGASKYIHEMDNNEIKLLEINGIITELQEEYPKQGYLKHLGERRIEPLAARMAPKFSLLYLPSCESTEVYNKFKDLIEQNRSFILHSVYSEAFKFRSDYYDRIMMILIILQAFVDMIILSPEYIISREVFDMRTIEYIFESQGVEFFSEIPLKYQKRLVKNLNRLIKFKSCDKNFVDIASLFGFDNVQLFKYYLLKDPVMNEDGTYKHDTYEDPKTGEEVEDLEANYELKFLKVPLVDGIAEEAIRDEFNLIPYDDVVDNDIYWNGTYTKEYVKQTILQHEFNMVISKYVGMETAYSLTEMTMELTYFLNMLLYSVDTSKLEIEIPEFSSTNKFPLIDCFIALFSLGYAYIGIKDSITYDPAKYMTVCGFNFETDMSKLASYVAEKGFTLEELGVTNFQIPENGIFTFDQLLYIYTENKNVYNHLVHEITHANDKDMYDIYYNIFKSLYTTNLNFDYFEIDGEIPETYSQFLNMKSNPLYNYIQECKNIEKKEDRELKISRYINYIVDNIYIYLSEEDFRHIFHGVPTASMDYLRQYLFLVLNFFKSYKVDFTHVNIVYTFDDKLENRINIIDRIVFKYLYTKTDKIDIDDFIQLLVHWSPADAIEIIDKITLDITHWTLIDFKDWMPPFLDKIKDLIITLRPSDKIVVDDTFGFYNHTYEWIEYINLTEKPQFTTSLTFKDKILLEDIATW